MSEQNQDGAGAAAAGAGGGDAAAAAAAAAAAVAAGGAGDGQAGAAAAGAGDGQAGAAAADPNPWWGKPELGLDQDTANFFAGRKAPSLAEALKSAVHAHKAVTDRNVIPKPDPAKLDPASWPGWKEMGWTEDRAAYQVESPKAKAPADYPYNDKLETAAIDAMHKRGIPPALAKDILAETMASSFGEWEGILQQHGEALRQAETALRGKWGAQYDANKALAQRAFKVFAPEGMDAAVLDEVMGAAGMVEFLHKIGAAFGEEKLVLPGSGGGLGARSETTVRAEIKLLEQQEGDALMNARHPRHDEINRKHRALLDELSKVAPVA